MGRKIWGARLVAGVALVASVAAVLADTAYAAPPVAATSGAAAASAVATGVVGSDGSGGKRPNVDPARLGPRSVQGRKLSALGAAGSLDPAVAKQVLLAWNDVWWGVDPPDMGFTGDVAACNEGTTSANWRSAELDTLNGLRDLAGVGPVAEQPASDVLAQRAALLMARTNALLSPPGVDPCGQSGALGAFLGSVKEWWLGPAAIIWEAEEYGVDFQWATRRQLMLHPGVQTVGFGDVPPWSGGYQDGYNATYLRDPAVAPTWTASRNGSFVPWPNSGLVPIPLSEPWGLLDRGSVIFDPQYGVSGAAVSITSSAGGAPVATDVTRTSSDLGGVVAWTPTRLPTTGESWTVTVSGLLLNGVATPDVSWTSTFQDLTFDSPLVKAAYLDFLGRAPAQSELEFQSMALWNGLVDREGFLRSLANSDEWLSAIVTKMYQDTLGRAPDAAGLSTWVSWIRSGRFTVAQAAALFYSSDEFYLGLGGGTLSSWVTALYAKLLGRAPDAAGLAAWVSWASQPGYGKPWVAEQFYQSLESRLTRVRNLYQALLGRDPDPTGWPYWADVIARSGDIELAVSLASSREYYLRSWDRF